MSGRALSAAEKRTLAALGLPTAALALSITVVSTYAPVVAQDFLSSTTVIGGLIAIEGVMALWLPLVVGSWSDRLDTPIGGRLPFLAASTPVAVVSLVAIGFSSNLPELALSVTIFFVAYFVAYEPYRALYPDLVRDEIAARAQSTQAVWRGVGTGLALVGGGLLVAIGEPVPFLAAAGIYLVAMAAFLEVARRRLRISGRRPMRPSVTDEARNLRDIVRDRPDLRAYLGANALWEASLGALKTFVFLYITIGLGKSEPAAAGIIGGVALLVLIAAPIGGELADRYGRVRVMSWSIPIYGLGLLVPAFTTSLAVLIPVVVTMGFGGALVMSLPFALLQPLMPEGHHGLLTGFYSLSRGIGTALGPLLAGIAIQVLRPVFDGTQGYAAMWLVCGGTALASIPFLRALRQRAGARIDPPADRAG